MRRKLTCFLLAALLTLTAVAEDLGEIIPEEEPAAEEIYEEIETQTEIEDITLDVSEPEEEIPVAENATTEEESVEVKSKPIVIKPEEIVEESEDIVEESEDIVEESEETETIEPEEVNIIEVESDVITLDDIEITVEPEVIEEVIEVAEESEVVEEPIMMAPMMVGLSLLGAGKASMNTDPDTSKEKNITGGYDYCIGGEAYKDNDARRYGFYYGTNYSIYTSDGSPVRYELYAEDATNQTEIIFVPLIDDEKVEFTFKVGSTTLSNQGYISALFHGKATFSITYASIYAAMSEGTSTVSIHCRTNSSSIFKWNKTLEYWYFSEWIVKDIDQTFTFTKHTTPNPATYSGSITLSKDQSVYPGDTVTITADIKLNKTVNDVTTEAEYKSVSIVWTVTSAEGGTNTYTTTDNKLEFIAENVTTYTVSAVATINY